MGLKILMTELFLRSILPPFYSFSMVEDVCKKKLRRMPADKDALWVLGNLYVHYKKFDEARPHLEVLYGINREMKSLRLLLAQVYYNLDEYAKVKKILEGGAILAPSARERFYLGDSLVELKEFDAAVDQLSIYVRYHKGAYVPFVKLGYAYYMRGSFDLAIEAYKRAEMLNPTSTEIKESIQICREKAGEN